MLIDYDTTRVSSYLLELDEADLVPAPIAPNPGHARRRLRINVKPVNNKPPKFISGDQPDNLYLLDSNKPGDRISTLLATDGDNPNPVSLIYEILPNSFDQQLARSASAFELRRDEESSGGVGLYSKEVLRVTHSPYTIDIKVSDGPSHLTDTLHSVKHIAVYVLNRGTVSVWLNSGSNLPVDYYKVQVMEELPADSDVIKVRANIPQIHLGHTNKAANKIVYSIVEDLETNETNPYFKVAFLQPCSRFASHELRLIFFSFFFIQIDSSSGRITTTEKRLDSEEKDVNLKSLMRNVRVKAASADNAFSYVTNVIIDLTDINDNKPVFDFVRSSNVLHTAENTTRPERQYLATVKVKNFLSLLR